MCSTSKQDGPIFADFRKSISDINLSLEWETSYWKVVSSVPTTAVLYQPDLAQVTHTQGEYLKAQMGRPVSLGRVSSMVQICQLKASWSYDPDRA